MRDRWVIQIHEAAEPAVAFGWVRNESVTSPEIERDVTPQRSVLSFPGNGATNVNGLPERKSASVLKEPAGIKI